jgi:hypothetical protein
MKGYTSFRGYQTRLIFDADKQSFVAVEVAYPEPFQREGAQGLPGLRAVHRRDFIAPRARLPSRRARVSDAGESCLP